MKLEIGGGLYPRGEGFINVDFLPLSQRIDQDPTNNVVCDLNSSPWPFPDGCVDELYSSHCIEHIDDFHSFLRECARICKIGAAVEIRCPDACGEMAMYFQHKGVVSINAMRHANHVFPHFCWKGTKQRLRLKRIEAGPDDYWFPLARSNPHFDGYSDEEILNWVPRTRHENRFHFVVEETEAALR